MKPLYISSVILIGISGLVSLYLFNNPVERSIIPHWVIPLLSFLGVVILIGAERGPRPKVKEKGFWSILLLAPVVGLLFQLHYLADRFEGLWFFESARVPFIGLHIFFVVVGNYVTTSQSLLTGLPTFWNMRSQLSWRRSHRFLGYGIVLVALISCIMTIVNSDFQPRILGFGMLALWICFIIYSWWVWRNDPNRKPLDGRA